MINMGYLNKRYQKLINFFYHQKELLIILKYLLVFLATACFFLYLTEAPVLADPDGFYHAKMSLLISQQGLIKDFPWFQATILKDYFTDHHLLYHLFLMPFVKFLPPLWGIKFSVVVLAGLLAVVFIWFLKSFQIKGAVFYWLIFLASTPLTFRLALVKANSLSLIFLLFGLYFIFKEKPWPLFFLSFFYVWLYGGWLLMLVLAGSYCFAIFFERLMKKTPKKETAQGITIDFLRIFIIKQSLKTKIFAASLWGLILGVVVNPYFPKNLFFYWQQVVQVGLINYQKVIGVGAEWYPYQLPELLVNAALAFLLLLPALILFLVDFKKQGRKTISLFFLNFFFLILTLKSRRYIEYFIPFSILFSAFSINLAAKTKTLAQFSLTIRQFPRYIKFLFPPLIICLVVLFSLAAFKGAEENKKSLIHGAPFTRFQEVSQWLSQNTPEHSIIFHDNWDSSPYLFYYNTHNYYLV
ncbi:MAG: hypothetical protein V1892_00155, partial [bacterium]